ncbi:MAG: peptidoglycan DD-metalloendopeptidase family protein [Clostridium sp.]|nr:peptidoglycan DD-metalloendopeptidase family protein [Clostridium sp.]
MRFLKKGSRKILIIAMVFVFAFSQTASATSIQEALDEKKVLESKKAEVENSIKDLEKEKENIIVYIEKLDQKLNKLNGEIQSLKENIEEANGNLDQIKADLENAEETAQNQYDTMKKRIKYMYENGSQDYVEVLLSANSISDFLNRVEYINKINEYDRNLLGKYEETKDLIAKKQVEQEDQIKKLKSMQEELTVEQEGVEKLSAKKTEQLRKKKLAIDSSKKEVSSYESAIAQQEELLEKLLEEERKRQEEELRKKQEALLQAQQQAQQNANNGSGNGGSTDSFGSIVATGNKFRWPLNISGTITSTFGYRTSPTAGASSNHKGIDIAVPQGTSVVAAANGTVTTASYQSAAGNYIMLSHGNGTYTVYMHLSSIKVSVGQTVSQGQVIGLSGNTGVSTGPHLHFGVNVNGSYVNPLNYVSKP